MSSKSPRLEEFKAYGALVDDVAKRIFDALARSTAVAILFQLAQKTRDPVAYVLFFVFGLALIAWMLLSTLLHSFVILEKQGFSSQSHKFPKALYFSAQLIMIGFVLYGTMTLMPELLRTLATINLRTE